MKKKFIGKIIVDMIMTVLLLLLMGRQLTGDFVHEWMGTGIFILWIIHHILNWNWYCHLFKGKYTLMRMIQNVVNFFGIAFHAGNDGKRNHTFQRGICFPADFRWDCYGKNNAYARSFLGIRTHVIAPWSALEYDSCHGAKNDGNNGR